MVYTLESRISKYVLYLQSRTYKLCAPQTQTSTRHTQKADKRHPDGARVDVGTTLNNTRIKPRSGRVKTVGMRHNIWGEAERKRHYIAHMCVHMKQHWQYKYCDVGKTWGWCFSKLVKRLYGHILWGDTHTHKLLTFLYSYTLIQNLIKYLTRPWIILWFCRVLQNKYYNIWARFCLTLSHFEP